MMAQLTTPSPQPDLTSLINLIGDELGIKLTCLKFPDRSRLKEDMKYAMDAYKSWSDASKLIKTALPYICGSRGREESSFKNGKRVLLVIT